MLGWFPDLQDDELLYSAWARYGDQRRTVRKGDVVVELFGLAAQPRPQIGLPTGIDSFLAMLPRGHRYGAEEIILRNTLFPYFACFLNADRKNHVKAAMRGRPRMSVHILLGTSSWNGFPGRFRFCPICVGEDRNKHGYTYWHTVHYLPGVEVCLRHNTFLEYSDVSTSGEEVKRQFVSAESIVDTRPAKLLDLSNKTHSQLLRLAQDASWIACHPDVNFDMEVTRKKYVFLLAERGLATYRGFTHTARITRAVSDYYGDLLDRLDCAIDVERPRNWIVRMLQYKESVVSPICHLLTMQFLEITPQQFHELPETPKYFGDGPWPCLNPKCADYQTKCINDYDLRFASKGKPQGWFLCPTCQFEYSRIGPDSSTEDLKRQPNFHKKYPQRKRAASNAGLLIRHKKALLEIQRTMPEIARKQLMTVNGTALNYVRTHDKAWLDEHFPSKQNAPSYAGSSPEMTAQFHEEIKSAIQREPGITRSDLAVQHKAAVAYLRAYDREWYEANLPARVVHHSGADRVDWAARDTEIAAKLPDAVRILLERTGDEHPIKVTKRQILIYLRESSSICVSLEKMPKTSNLINELAESTVQFALRRLKWVAAHQQGPIPTRSRLCREANLDELLDYPEIQNGLDDALATFR